MEASDKSKKNTHFKVDILPWILYGILAFLTLLLIFMKGIGSESIQLSAELMLLALGIAIGLVIIRYTNRSTKITKREYLGMSSGMIACWIVSVLDILLSMDFSILFGACIALAGICAGYLALYIPRSILYKHQIEEASQTTKR